MAAAIVPGSDVRLTGVGVNPTRTGLYDLLVAMGAEVRHGDTETRRHGAVSPCPRVPASPRPARVNPSPTSPSTPARCVPPKPYGDLIVRAIDEFPIFAVAATQAEGTTVIREAAELRVKESDRIASVAASCARWACTSRSAPTAC